MHPIAQETGWQSGVRSSIMPGLPRHLVQELNISNVPLHLHLNISCFVIIIKALTMCSFLGLPISTDVLTRCIVEVKF